MIACVGGSATFNGAAGAGGATGGGLAARVAHEFPIVLSPLGLTDNGAGEGFGDDLVDVVDADMAVGSDGLKSLTSLIEISLS